jgi:two-component system, response regulator PdtaR
LAKRSNCRCAVTHIALLTLFSANARARHSVRRRAGRCGGPKVTAPKDAGHLILEARDGVEAIAIIELRDDVAVLFTDVTMPNMNGVALARVVRERWPHIGIVMTSGALPPDVKLELPEGARFLAKPYKPKQLLQEIQAVLPLVGAPVAIKSLSTMQPGKMHGAGGLAQPLPEPDE